MQQHRLFSRPTIFVIAAVAVFAARSATADVKPHDLFSDHMVLQRDAKVAVWGSAAEGEKVTVKIADKTASTTAKGGKWLVKIGPLPAGGPHTLAIAGQNTVEIHDVLVGEVWICSGQSNMEWGLRSSENGDEAIKNCADDSIRLFQFPKNSKGNPQTAIPNNAKWHECSPKNSGNFSVGGFSAVGYYFGRKLRNDLKVPIGLINTSWGGTPAEAWTSEAMLAAEPRLKAEILDPFHKAVKDYPAIKARAEKARDEWNKHKDEPKNKGKRAPQVFQSPFDQPRATTLFNGMIAPLVPFGIRGAIWYQGESNAGNPDQYRELMPALIRDWRNHFAQGDFPFYMVQLAPYERAGPKGSWPELREAQRQTTYVLPNVGMAVITDVGDKTDIHPKRKKQVGERLAAAALEDVYKLPIVGHSPDYKSMTVRGREVVLEFTHVGGGLVTSDGAAPTGFLLCGEDHKFGSAEAKLEGDKVVVSSSSVDNPVAVRFAWVDYPEVNLFNKEGFPATPFRTDDFPFVTGPRAKAKTVVGR
jgi:sialate O-acetylesterase